MSERNLTLYPLYQTCRNALFWIPVFFLYFSSVVELHQALQLEAIYFLSVVLLEVPSGYFSDRIGRKPTLILAMLFWSSACFLFAGTASFGSFAVAQVLMAAGMAFNSGTDSALLFDSLQSAGKDADIGFHEARAETYGFFSAAAAGLIGGLIAGVDLRWAYVLSGLAALCGLFTAIRFHEPPHIAATPERALSPTQQLGACFRKLQDRVLLWVFVFAVAMTVFNHVPYEFFQPYIGFLLSGTGASGYALTPAAAGLHLAGTAFLSALLASRSMYFRKLLGVPGALLGVLLLQILIMGAMATFVHPAVAALLLLRSVPRAILTPISRSVMHPRLERGIRATYLSLVSLVGRLSFSGTLWLAAWAAADSEGVTHETMGGIVHGYLVAAAIVFALLLTGAPALARATREPATDRASS